MKRKDTQLQKLLDAVVSVKNEDQDLDGFIRWASDKIMLADRYETLDGKQIIKAMRQQTVETYRNLEKLVSELHKHKPFTIEVGCFEGGTFDLHLTNKKGDFIVVTLGGPIAYWYGIDDEGLIDILQEECEQFYVAYKLKSLNPGYTIYLDWTYYDKEGNLIAKL